jgi:hypothetical protein
VRGTVSNGHRMRGLGQIRSATVWVAIAAMAVRALMPVGWMPSAAAQTTLMPCPMMDGMRKMRMPEQPQHPAKHRLPASHEGSICAFATAAQPVRTVEPHPIELAPLRFAFFAPAAPTLAPSWDHAPRAPPAAA